MSTRSLLQDYWDSLRHPEFWMYATWLGLVTKYRTSRLGMIWAFIPAVFYSFGVGWFFAYLQRIDPLEFIPHLGIGYLIFRLITTSLNECTTTYSAHSSFVLDGRVRLTDYILRVVGKAAFYFVLALPIIGAALAISPSFRFEGLLWLPLTIAIVLLNIAWMGAIVSILGARLRDMHELMGSVLMFAFLFTPIIWRSSQVPADTLRGGIARANPLFHLIEVVRAPLLGEPLERLTFVYLTVMLLLGGAIATIIYRRYARYVPVWL